MRHVGKVVEFAPEKPRADLGRCRRRRRLGEWLNTEVTFRLDWKEDRTFVLFKHVNWKEPVEFMHHCSTKWATFLLSLRDLLEKSEGRPIPRDLRIAIDG